MQERVDKRNRRNSSIELLKIFALALIVINHVVSTLWSPSPYFQYDDYMIDLGMASTSISQLLLAIFSYFGELGNDIFFVCSAYFLLNSKAYNKKKWFLLFGEIWFISVSIMFASVIYTKGNIPGELVVGSFFPTTFANNWYLTMYLLFYPIHPFLNMIVYNISQKSLFRLTCAMSFLYLGMNFILDDLFFYSYILVWITIYFIIAYMKLYLQNYAEKVRYNAILLAIGMLGYVGLVVLTNHLGLSIERLSNNVLYWMKRCNPFLIMIAIAAINLAKKIEMNNKVINYLSGLSLVVYVLHENIILRSMLRPRLWRYIYSIYGYKHIISWSIVISFVVLLISIFVAIVYDKTIRNLVQLIESKIYEILKKAYLHMESFVL
nr:acyltransferase family protein [uncultured Butyrivibrio sp.]